MHRHTIRLCLAIFVSGFCLLGFLAQGADAPIDKNELRYDGKPFEYWRTYLRTELKAERRIDGIRALAAFGPRGHAESAATAIVDAVKDYGEDAYDGTAEHQTLDQKVIEAATEAVVKVGPSAFEIVLQNAKNANVRRFAENVYGHTFKDKRVNVLSPCSVRTLLDYLRADDVTIRDFAANLLGKATRDYPPSKDNVLTVLRAEKDTARLVRSLIELLLDERKCNDSLVHFAETFGSQGKAAAAALVKYRLRGWSIDDNTFKAIGAEAKELIPEITEGLKSQKVEERTRAVKWLAEMGVQAKPALPALLQEINEGPKKKTRPQAASATGVSSSGWGAAAGAYATPYEQSNEEEKAWLDELRPSRRIGAEIRMLMPSMVRVVADGKRTCGCRIEVTKALGELGAAARDALPALHEAAKATEPALCEAAAAAIAKIEGQKPK